MAVRAGAVGCLDLLMKLSDERTAESTSELDPIQQDKQPGKGAWPRHILGVTVSIVCLWLMFRQIKLDELQTAFDGLEWHFVALGVASLAFGYVIRIQRWAIMLRAGDAHVSSRACIAPFMGSITLNNVLPFRAGDFVRALVFPAAIGVRRVTATASLLLERLVDLLTLLLSLGIGLLLSPIVNLPVWIAETAVTLSLVAGIGLFLVVAFNSFFIETLTKIQQGFKLRVWTRLGNGLGVAKDLLQSFGVMSRLIVLFPLLLLSMMVWIGEAGLFWALLKGLDISAGFASALIIMAIATLSTLVPSSPGYIGPFHLAAFSAVSMLGGTSSQAASFAVLAHLGLWLPTTLVGAVFIFTNPNLFRGSSADLPPVKAQIFKAKSIK